MNRNKNSVSTCFPPEEFSALSDAVDPAHISSSCPKTIPPLSFTALLSAHSAVLCLCVSKFLEGYKPQGKITTRLGFLFKACDISGC